MSPGRSFLSEGGDSVRGSEVKQRHPILSFSSSPPSFIFKSNLPYLLFVSGIRERGFMSSVPEIGKEIWRSSFPNGKKKRKNMTIQQSFPCRLNDHSRRWFLKTGSRNIKVEAVVRAFLIVINLMNESA